MKHYIKQRLRESLLSEDDDIKQSIISLLKSGDIDNIELAYMQGPNFNINPDELVKSIYGKLLNVVEGDTIKDKLIKLLNKYELHLDLSGDLPEAIGYLTNLRLLYLLGDNLTSLPDSIGNLKNLKELAVWTNPLSDDEKVRTKKLLPNTDILF